MDKIVVRGGNRLEGIIPISGAKNAALPLMIASLLTPGTLELKNMPHLADIESLKRILRPITVLIIMLRASVAGKWVRVATPFNFSTPEIVDTTAPYDLVSRMRGKLLGYWAAVGSYGRSTCFSSRWLCDWHKAR